MDLLLHLRAFVAVAEEGHVTRAAAAVGSAQPVVSRQLQTLERTLGVTLFDRSGRRLRLTEDGAALLPAARDLIGRSEDLVAGVRSNAARAARSVRIAVPRGSDPRALAEAIALAAGRNVRLVVTEADATERAERLADGRAEAALVAATAGDVAFVVPLGLAGAPGAGPFETSAAIPLDRLRPRSGRARAPVVLLQPEDEPVLRDDLGRDAARAGLTADQIEPAAGDSGTTARVLAGPDLLLCSRAEAYRHALVWRPLAPSRQRGYRLVTRGPVAVELADDLLPLLRRAVGGRRPDRDPGSAPRRAAIPSVIFG